MMPVGLTVACEGWCISIAISVTGRSPIGRVPLERSLDRRCGRAFCTWGRQRLDERYLGLGRPPGIGATGPELRPGKRVARQMQQHRPSRGGGDLIALAVELSEGAQRLELLCGGSVRRRGRDCLGTHECDNHRVSLVIPRESTAPNVYGGPLGGRLPQLVFGRLRSGRHYRAAMGEVMAPDAKSPSHVSEEGRPKGFARVESLTS